MDRLLRLLGFSRDDYEEDEYSDYEDEQLKPVKKNRPVRKDEPRGRYSSPRLVFFQGIPSEEMKLRLRDVLLDGAMLVLSLQGAGADRIHDARDYINFMRGVAFAHRGQSTQIGSSLFVITPREGMFQEWSEEGIADDGAFDR
ncbi:MAG: cell division protein SepF [Synergistaceae bacterium]|nr:cell division protein SepF [Synergistaceae bacterium]